MSKESKIEWTEDTWNPTTGCTKVSDGCVNCYAEEQALRLKKWGVEKYANGFKLTLHPETLDIPLKWRNPRLIFVNSMSDLFHKDVPEEFIFRVWGIMDRADWHTYQILTKRPERMLEVVSKIKKVLPNVWLGTSVENRDVVDRIDILRKVPAKVRFISFEPLLDSVGKINLEGIHWAIVGGESGQNHRPIKKEWILEILKQCQEQNVAFFFKQWGGITHKSGGNILNGRTYEEYPYYLRQQIKQTTLQF